MPELIDLIGLVVLLLIGGLLIGLQMRNQRNRTQVAFRPIAAYSKLRGYLSEGIETGRRVHFGIGTGSVGAEDTSATLVGIQTMQAAATTLATAEKTPIVTAADGTSFLLAQDVLRTVYQQVPGAADRYDADAVQMVGVSPWSYAAGASMVMHGEKPIASVTLGDYGDELLPVLEAGDRVEARQLAGTTNNTGQAVPYVGVDDAVIGEEVYAVGAYLTPERSAYVASLQTQDIMRLLIVGSLIIGSIVLTVLDIFG